jgi:hypothetical protein
MKKLASIVLIILALLFSAINSSAQQTISETKKALIKELLEATGAKRNIDQMLQTTLAMQKAQSARMLVSSINDDKSIPQDEKSAQLEKAKAQSDRMTKRLYDYLTTEFNITAVMENISYTVYDRYFTEDELKDLISFYESPSGKKYISVVPNVIADSMSIFLENHAPKLEEFVKKAVDEELVQLKKDVNPPSPKRQK